MYDIIILCGGEATRLHPLTKYMPKSLITINGTPFINHQLKLLQKRGFRNVVLATGFLGEKIKGVVKHNHYDLDISFSDDGDRKLGTGGAIKNAFPLLSNTFFILYGDSYLSIDYANIQNYYAKNNIPGALMTVYRNTNKKHKNNIVTNGKNILQYDKENFNSRMEYIDYGITIANKSIFSIIDDVEFDLQKLYKKLVNMNKLYAYEIKQRFYEIGSFEGIQEFEKYIKERDNG